MIVFTVLLPYYLVIKTDFVHFMEQFIFSIQFPWTGSLNTLVSEFDGMGSHCLQQGKKNASAPQASMGLATMLLGVSGSCEDIEATSLPVELEPGPPSEKLTCVEG